MEQRHKKESSWDEFHVMSWQCQARGAALLSIDFQTNLKSASSVPREFFVLTFFKHNSSIQPS